MSQESIELTLDPRSVTGKAVKHLRKAGKIPAVIHDHGRPSVLVEGDALALIRLYRQAGKHHPVNIKTGDQTFTAMIKAVEFEPRKNRLNHIVFNAVAADQVVEAEIPIQPRYAEGNEAAPAEKTGLIVLNNLESVEVEALPRNLPDVIYYDGEKLVEIGDHISVSDLMVPADVTIITDPNQAVATVYEPSALAAANDAAGGTEEEPEAEVVEEGEEAAAEGETATEGKQDTENASKD